MKEFVVEPHKSKMYRMGDVLVAVSTCDKAVRVVVYELP